jgi:hypothetical protein
MMFCLATGSKASGSIDHRLKSKTVGQNKSFFFMHYYLRYFFFYNNGKLTHFVALLCCIYKPGKRHKSDE